MSKAKNPTEKKRLSLSMDRRNIFGENSKSSRKNIAGGSNVNIWINAGPSPKFSAN